MSIVEEIRELMDPDRDGGVSGYELSRAMILLGSAETELSVVTAERDSLLERVMVLEAGLYPFQHPDFTKIRRPDTHPMFGYDNASLTYGDFARARELFTTPRPGAEPRTETWGETIDRRNKEAPPELSACAKRVITEAQPPSGLQGKQ